MRAKGQTSSSDSVVEGSYPDLDELSDHFGGTCLLFRPQRAVRADDFSHISMIIYHFM